VDSGKRCLKKTSTGIGQEVGVKCIRASRVGLDFAFSSNNLGQREERVNDVYDVVRK